jgi:hypothetical protein
MGLANNEILKVGVDTLTLLLETVNKITEAVSGDGGLTKSIVSLLTVVGALKGGNALLGKAFGEESLSSAMVTLFEKKKEQKKQSAD